jgi:hypothetical protein
MGMNAKRKKTIVIPDEPGKGNDRGPLLAWVGHGDDDGRDPTRPLAVDENGDPLYFAPRGVMYRIPWP